MTPPKKVSKYVNIVEVPSGSIEAFKQHDSQGITALDAPKLGANIACKIVVQDDNIGYLSVNYDPNELKTLLLQHLNQQHHVHVTVTGGARGNEKAYTYAVNLEGMLQELHKNFPELCIIEAFTVNDVRHYDSLAVTLVDILPHDDKYNI